MFHGPAAPAPHPTPEAAPAESVRAAYRALLAIGLSDSEAGNLTAHLAGLGPVRQGWEIREVDRLLVIRSLVATGRLER